MNKIFDLGIAIFHTALFLAVAFITFWMGVDKAGYEDIASQRMERLSQLSMAQLGEVRVNG